MTKAIFIDVDGTLVDYENNLPESATAAIRQARENGHKVYICTGRSKAEVYPYIWDIGLDGMIGGNGSYAEHENHVLMHQTLTTEETKRVVDWLSSRGLEFYIESNNGLFASENFESRGAQTIKEYSKRKGADNTDNVTIRDAFPDMIFDGELVRDDVNKISFILNSYQDFLDAKSTFPELKAGTWGGKGEVALFGDLGVKDIDKSVAIEVVLEHLGVDKEDTFAFGDAKVDIPMLEYCNVGVAVASGGDEIKEMADYITDAVNEDGLYNAFKHFDLI